MRKEDTRTHAAVKMMESIPLAILKAKELAFGQVFHDCIVGREKTYRDVCETLNAYSTSPIPEKRIQDEMEYAGEHSGLGASVLLGILTDHAYSRGLKGYLGIVQQEARER